MVQLDVNVARDVGHETAGGLVAPVPPAAPPAPPEGTLVRLIERRRRPRLALPSLSLVVEGHRYDTVDWSLDGCVIDGYAGTYIPGSLFTVPFLSGLDGILAAVAIRSRVVRLERDHGRLAIRFLHMDAVGFDLLVELTGEAVRRMRAASDAQ